MKQFYTVCREAQRCLYVLCSFVPLDVDLFNDISFFLISVMDVTDIINGKVDDEDKQHFIPFQP